MRKRYSSKAMVVAGLLALPASPINATTLVMLDEDALVLQADVITEGVVTRIESATRPGTHIIETFITIAVTDLLKGSMPLLEVTARESGGQVAGKSRWLFGSPEYELGETVIVFLERRGDGSLGTVGMALGKFRVQGDPGSGEQWIDRQLRREATQVIDPKGHRSLALAERRPKDAFKQYIRYLTRHQPKRLASGALRTYTAPLPGSQRSTTGQFKLFNNVRWFEPDEGQPVPYYVDSLGDSSLGRAKSAAAIDSALAAWGNVDTASIVLTAGATTGPTRISGCDGKSKIIFNDPFDEISDPSSCSGILAVGGYCAGADKKTINGVKFTRIAEGDVTFNNGWGSCSFWNKSNLAEVATHELGHTIGLAHSTNSDATMAAFAHFDGRGASLTPDDEAGVAFIYPLTSVPKPAPTPPLPADDQDGDGVPDLVDNCPNQSNTDQADTDEDGAGDLCDNCSALPNPEQQPRQACRSLDLKRLSLKLSDKRGDQIRLRARFFPSGSHDMVAMASAGINVAVTDLGRREIFAATVPTGLLTVGRRGRRLKFSDRQGVVLSGLTRLSVKISKKGLITLKLTAARLDLNNALQPKLALLISLNSGDYAGLTTCKTNRRATRLTCPVRRRRR